MGQKLLFAFSLANSQIYGYYDSLRLRNYKVPDAANVVEKNFTNRVMLALKNSGNDLFKSVSAKLPRIYSYIFEFGLKRMIRF